MSAQEEFRIFWKHYGVAYAEDNHVQEAMHAFIVAIERQVAIAFREQLCAA